jgi:hypothetical protein
MLYTSAFGVLGYTHWIEPFNLHVGGLNHLKSLQIPILHIKYQSLLGYVGLDVRSSFFLLQTNLNVHLCYFYPKLGPPFVSMCFLKSKFLLVKLPFSSLGTSRAMPCPQLPGTCDLTLGSLGSERWPSEFQQGHRVLDAASVPCKVVGGLGNVKPLQFLIYLRCINICIYILPYLNMSNNVKCIIDL